MNPFDWDAPWAVLFAALFAIVFFRSNLFHLIGRGLVSGLAKPSCYRATSSLRDIEEPNISFAATVIQSSLCALRR